MIVRHTCSILFEVKFLGEIVISIKIWEDSINIRSYIHLQLILCKTFPQCLPHMIAKTYTFSTEN